MVGGGAGVDKGAKVTKGLGVSKRAMGVEAGGFPVSDRGPRTFMRGHVFSSGTPGRHIHHCQGLPAQAPATGAGSGSKGLKDEADSWARPTELADPSWQSRSQESGVERCLRMRLH